LNGQNTNGWFIGFIEHGENTYCFATNLQNSENATGSAASEITIEILNSLFS
jgi:beta-lactamase class D